VGRDCRPSRSGDIRCAAAAGGGGVGAELSDSPHSLREWNRSVERDEITFDAGGHARKMTAGERTGF
jgi:hypothetical protein